MISKPPDGSYLSSGGNGHQASLDQHRQPFEAFPFSSGIYAPGRWIRPPRRFDFTEPLIKTLPIVDDRHSRKIPSH